MGSGVKADGQNSLFQGIGDQGQDLLVFIQQKHGPQVPQSFVGESRRRQQLQTFDLAEMSSFSEGEQIQQLCNVVPPIQQAEALEERCDRVNHP